MGALSRTDSKYANRVSADEYEFFDFEPEAKEEEEMPAVEDWRGAATAEWPPAAKAPKGPQKNHPSFESGIWVHVCQ